MSASDLFTWREEADASAAAAEAEEVRAVALRAYRVAPHGQVRAREQRLQAATLEALRREVALEAARKREAGE